MRLHRSQWTWICIILPNWTAIELRSGFINISIIEGQWDFMVSLLEMKVQFLHDYLDCFNDRFGIICIWHQYQDRKGGDWWLAWINKELRSWMVMKVILRRQKIFLFFRKCVHELFIISIVYYEGRAASEDSQTILGLFYIQTRLYIKL